VQSKDRHSEFDEVDTSIDDACFHDMGSAVPPPLRNSESIEGAALDEL